jgi:hypothetical protein
VTAPVVTGQIWDTHFLIADIVVYVSVLCLPTIPELDHERECQTTLLGHCLSERPRATTRGGILDCPSCPYYAGSAAVQSRDILIANDFR